MDTFQINIDHIRLVTAKPVQEVTKALELQLGRFDNAIQAELAQTRDLPAAKDKIAKMEGPSTLMIFSVFEHGLLLDDGGKQKKATQYVIGNPLIARRMTRHDIRAALYAPLRILVYENNENKTCIEYDRPSSLFSQFGNAEVTQVALELDQKLETLFTGAMAT